MNSASYSRRGYMRVKKEATAGVALATDTLVEFLTESIAVNWDWTQVGAVAGSRSLNLRAVKDVVGPFVGSIELYVEPKTAGHFLCGVFGEDAHTTATAGVSELSVFTPKDVLPTYTVDIARAGCGYVNRFFGVRFVKAVLSIDGNKLKMVVDVAAQRVFTNARVTAAVGSGTTLSLDQTSGIVAGDSLLVLDKDAPGTTLATLTASAPSDENTVTVSTIAASLEVGDIAVIAAAVIDDEDYARSKELTFVGGASVSFGKGRDAMQRLVARTNCEQFEVTVDNGYKAVHAGTGINVVDRMPSTILLKGVGVTAKVGQLHANPELVDVLRSTDPIGIRARFQGQVLEANVAAAATATLASGSTGTVVVTAEAAGEDGNDYAIRVVQGTGTLSAALSGKLITVTLDTDTADNAVALVASVIDGLTGVSATSTSTGNVTAAANPDKVSLAGGRAASEREMLEIDLPSCVFAPFTPNVGADDVLMDTIDLTAQRDPDDGREARVRLRNSVASY